MQRKWFDIGLVVVSLAMTASAFGACTGQGTVDGTPTQDADTADDASSEDSSTSRDTEDSEDTNVEPTDVDASRDTGGDTEPPEDGGESDTPTPAQMSFAASTLFVRRVPASASRATTVTPNRDVWR